MVVPSNQRVLIPSYAGNFGVIPCIRIPGPCGTPPGTGFGVLYTSTSADKEIPDVELIPITAKEVVLDPNFPDELVS